MNSNYNNYNNYSNWNTWIQQMMQQMKEQQKLIDQLTQKIEQLQSQEPPPRTVIEKIEYHFDQLKIETLEGTLQIGLTPQGMAENGIEDLYTGQSEDYEVEKLMNDIVPRHVDEYSASLNLNLTNDHREKIINDINQQLPERFMLYKQKNPHLNNQLISERISEEISNSVIQYLDKYYKEGS
ncbi:spore germination protein GerPC [Halobacillus massiliensis]|uniref:spore germination protein GerPC n=1 Tax=Halobacillus massiliensis TaxID=1926286 RepID=UPI0009E2ACB1|nr:spore germination protein GerPC [Halobacillus massiliensis]